jgi:WD40 repeat protein
MLVWQAHKAKVRSLAFSPDGRYIATTSGHSRFVWLWEATTGKRIRQLSANYRAARVVAFFLDGIHLAATLYGGGGWICDVETGEIVAEFFPKWHDPDMLAVSPDGKQLVIGNMAGVEVWDNPLDAPGGTMDRSHARNLPLVLRGTPRIGFSPKGTYFCGAEWAMRLCDPNTFKELRTLRAPVGNASAATFAFTPDESRLVVAFGYSAAVWRVGEWDVPSVRIPGHTNLVRAVGFLPGGGTVLSAAMDGTVRLWDSTTGAETRSFDWGIGKIQAAAVSPDGTLCAAGSDSGQIVVWDVDN